MATNQVATVPKKGFMDLPPEMRNQIYETLTSDTRDSPVITTNKLNCRSIFDLVLSLGLHNRFPLLATSKEAAVERAEVLGGGGHDYYYLCLVFFWKRRVVQLVYGGM